MLKVLSRWSGWALLVAAVMAACVWGVSLATSRHLSIGKHTIGFDQGAIEIGTGSVRIGRGPEGWVFPPGVRVVLDRPAGWLPAMNGARFWIGQGVAANTPMTLRVDYVRFAFLVPVLLVPGVILWLLGRRRIKPGHCRGCGYDLRGLPAAGCPECGEGVIARAWRRLTGLLAARGQPSLEFAP